MYTESLVKHRMKAHRSASRLTNIIGTMVVACVLTVGLLIFLTRVPTAAQGLTDGISDWTADGGIGGNFGNAIANVGDVNGDGYGDVLIGAWRHNGNQGQAYVYLGGKGGLAATPAHTLTGEIIGDRFGYAVGGVGDVNGDGYSDVLIGASGHYSERGQVYLYMGGAEGLTTNPTLTIAGESVWDRFGRAVGSAGDVNGDGYSDVLVAAPGYYSFRGRVYLYLGGEDGLSAFHTLSLSGNNPGNYFGSAVGSAGDVNGDGYGDVIVGEQGYNNNQGRVYVYLGSESGLSLNPAFTLTGENIDDYFGKAVGGAGDVNGDGYSDVIVGAWGYNSKQGQAYVYLGGAEEMSATPAFILTGENTNDYFGEAVGGAEDVNGDGYGDVIIGAPHYNNWQGRTYVYLGGVGGVAATPILALTGENIADRFGCAVGSAGDVNGDGYSDVLIGAQSYNDWQGRAYAYHGAAATTPAATPALILSGQNTDYFGAVTDGVGDVNGDGYSDALIGAYAYNDNQGRAYLYLGGSGGLAATSALTLTGEMTNTYFGRAMGGAGDVNGDGNGDVIIGAWGYNNNQGRAYVYLGSTEGVTATPAFTLTGENIDDYFGSAVGSAGDVNGDGYGDVLIGAWGYNGEQGRTYVYLGDAGGLSATPAFIFTGKNTLNRFGCAVEGVGDVNGDGYGDILVGAWRYNTWQGQVYVYLGSAEGLTEPPVLTLTGEKQLHWFGSAMGGAGDVNGDGYSDVLIGARGYETQRGKAYLYLGGAGGLSANPARTFTGENAGDYFGAVVGGTGDVNGDGYSDALIGAEYYNNKQGRAYVYLGGAGGLSENPALVLTGENTGDYFGVAVGGAGDVNGDGYSDVLIGAEGYNSNQGRTYAYYGNTGAGRVALPRQGRADKTLVLPWEISHMQPWGLSHTENSFQVFMQATSPRGREQAKLQVQACPPGVPFTHHSCIMHTAADWTDVTSATQGVSLTTVVVDLHPGTLYRWRARVLYAAHYIVPSPQPAHGPWRRLYAQSFEAGIRTDPRLWNNAPVTDAGDDHDVQAKAIATLDGSRSYDPDGDALSYRWAQVGGPWVGFDPYISVTTFTAPPSATVLTFTLSVDDDPIGTVSLPGTPDPDTVVITVYNNIYVYLPLLLKDQ